MLKRWRLHLRAGHNASEHEGVVTFTELSQEHLQRIIQQVKADGYCVESLAVFRISHLKPSETIAVIEQWAAGLGLKVGFNHEYQLCFFERL